MFYVGIAPAIIALIARFKVREPERWKHAQHVEAGSGIAELWNREHRRNTFIGSALSFVAVFGLWGSTNWTPSLVHEFLAPKSIRPDLIGRMVSYAVMALNVGAIAGYLSFPVLAEKFGRKPAFGMMLAGSAIALPSVFLMPKSFTTFLVALPILGFFTNGLFGGFPIYFPELYPTHIRATGCGFCYNVGRLFAAAGPFITGYLVAALGTLACAASSVAAVYIVGLAVLPFARETKGQPLR
jgi:MFS family permease